MKNTAIVLQDRGELYKISKVILHRDGSFSLAIPYCEEEQGCVFKNYVDYDLYKFTIAKDQMIQKFSLDGHAKVTMHVSGFVQFSGKGITSGVDKTTGKIKGMGLFSSPLDRPIKTGPTLGAMIWGLSSGYLKFEGGDKDALVFRDEDYYYRHTSKESYNCYLVEIFVFPGVMKIQVRQDLSGLYIYNQFFQYRGKPGAIFKLRVIYLIGFPSFLGILVTRSNAQIAESPYGFQLSTPSGAEEYINGKLMRPGMCAVYPPPPFMSGLTSLKYENNDNR